MTIAVLAATPAHGQDIGAVAPDFSAPYAADSAAPPWHLWSRAPAQLTILSFWATWCKPCETLHPWMEALARSYASRGVQVVTINMREPADSIRRLLAADTGSVTLDVLDPDGHVTELYSVTSVPTTLLVAENNVVLRRWEGVSAAMGGIEPVMNRLLGPAPAARGSRPLGCSE
ncbi:MAG: thiol:disulfide interchange protein DsbE [Gemmatimonadetes bacterium]|nr:thiol:disulfide interchange protein DsbE [Gemmatimonadota bacterium]